MNRVTYHTSSALPSPQQGGHLFERDRLLRPLGLGFVGQPITETIDGARTTHYRETVNSDGLIGERLDQFMQLEVSDPLTLDLWIDGDDRTKQFRLRAEHNDMLASTGDGPLDLTVTFLDINQPVTVKAPPTKDTVPLAGDAQEG